MTEDPYASAYPVNWGARVRVILKDGSEFETRRENAKGDPEAPLSKDDMVAKAEMLLAHGGVRNPKAVIDGVLGLASEGGLPDLSLL